MISPLLSTGPTLSGAAVLAYIPAPADMYHYNDMYTHAHTHVQANPHHHPQPTLTTTRIQMHTFACTYIYTHTHAHMNNHIYSPLFKTQERESDSSNEETEKKECTGGEALEVFVSHD